MRPRDWCVLAIAFSACLFSSAALGDTTEEARTLFNVGAKAYEHGDFTSAILAFEQAYSTQPRPGILFSIAQAHRRQYVVDKKPGHVATAIFRLRQYLEQVPAGERRADAVAALAELEPIAAELERKGELTPLSPQGRPSDDPPRLMISSPVPGATILIDGKKTLPAPISVEIEPGQHTLEVRAPGFLEDRRTILVAPKGVTALDIALRERPALVSIFAVEGARVQIDGRDEGALPLARPIEVAPGRHRVVITKPGRTEHIEDLRLARGEARTINAPMPWTMQRKVAVSLFAGSAASAVTGVVFTVLAFRAQTEATGILNRMQAGKVTCKSAACPEIAQYHDALQTRGFYRVGAGALAGLTALTAGTGLALLVTETPTIPPPPSDDAEKPSDLKGAAPTELSLAPMLGPGQGGVVFSGRF